MTGQSTVTATIPAYAGGSVVAIFQSQGAATPTIRQVSGTLDDAGVFTLTAWDNTFAAYSPSVTVFNISVGFYPATNYSVTVAIAGDFEDISALFTNAPSPTSGDASTINGISITGTPQAGYVPVAIDATSAEWQDTGGGDIPYPGAGIPNSTGSAWGTSYTPTGTGQVITTSSASSTITATLGDIVLEFDNGGIITAADFIGGAFNGDGSALTGLQGGNIAAGAGSFVPVSAGGTGGQPTTSAQVFVSSSAGAGAFTATPTFSGTNLTSLNATNISSGTIAAARLPSTITSDTSGNAATATSAVQVNGGTLPPSVSIVATNSSSQLIAATMTGTGTTAVLSASPTLTGVPTAPTASANTNTTQVATTAFVAGQAATSAPIVDGTATIGTSLLYARQDHVHPTDTSRAPLASPALTGTPTASTPATGTNTTQIATTAFVQSQLAATSPSLGGTLSNANVAVSAGAGTGGSATLTGLDATHILTVTTGTLPTLSAAIATVTFSASRGHITYAVLTPANAATALLSGTSMVFMSANSATAYTVSAGSVALTAATTYAWNVVAL